MYGALVNAVGEEGKWKESSSLRHTLQKSICPHQTLGCINPLSIRCLAITNTCQIYLMKLTYKYIGQDLHWGPVVLLKCEQTNSWSVLGMSSGDVSESCEKITHLSCSIPVVRPATNELIYWFPRRNSNKRKPIILHHHCFKTYTIYS